MVAMPSEFRYPEYNVRDMPEDTRNLYEHLIAKRAVLTVYEIDEWGVPWIEYTWEVDRQEQEHSLGIDHDGWEHI